MARPAIAAANEEAFRRIVEADPVLVDIRPAHELLPALTPTAVLHAGPPLRWTEMCGPLQGAVIGALRYEGLARTEGEALSHIDEGRIAFAPCHHHAAVGPMTGIITRSMPLLVVENRGFGNRAFCPLNEGLGKVLRFGANDDSVLERLRWLADVFAPAFRRAVRRRRVTLDGNFKQGTIEVPEHRHGRRRPHGDVLDGQHTEKRARRHARR